MTVEEDGNNLSWVVELGKMLDAAAAAGPTSSTSGNPYYIYRVPQWITEMTSSKAYAPSVVSLGPIHHSDPALLPMEAHKRRAVVNLVRRSGKPLREFVDAVEEVAPHLEEAYERLGEDYVGSNSGRFVEMMLTDGCFLLELVRAFLLEGDVEKDYGCYDPVFSKHGYRHLRHVLVSDVLLMENQLPMLLLRRILTIMGGSESYFMLDTMIRKRKIQHCWIQEDYAMRDQVALHPLHFFLTWGNRGETAVGAASSASFASWIAFWRRPHCSASDSFKNEDHSESMPTATELHEAGIHFKAISRSIYGEWSKLEDISFERGIIRSILSIPVVQVDDYTEKKYLNLMAFERLEPGADTNITDFIFFMDGIIDSAKDVALLRSSGVIVNLLGSDEEVADLFSKVLAKGAALSQDSRLRGVYRDVNAHCRKPWNKWRAMFMQTYMSNPWVFVSLVAAVILLVATLVQTVYSVASFNQG